MNKVKYYGGIRGLIFTAILFFSSIFSIFYIHKGIFFTIFNIFALIVCFCFLVMSFYYIVYPRAIYDEDGFTYYTYFNIKKPKAYSWKDVAEVYSKTEMYDTWVIMQDGFPWIISSSDRNNYFDTLRDLLKYIPEKKFDELTLKRAKGPKKKYFI